MSSFFFPFCGTCNAGAFCCFCGRTFWASLISIPGIIPGLFTFCTYGAKKENRSLSTENIGNGSVKKLRFCNSLICGACNIGAFCNFYGRTFLFCVFVTPRIISGVIHVLHLRRREPENYFPAKKKQAESLQHIQPI